MITRTDIHYIFYLVAYCASLTWYWTSKIRQRSSTSTSSATTASGCTANDQRRSQQNTAATNASSFPDMQTLNRFTSSSKSAGMVVLALMLVTGIAFNFICAALKYHYSYVQIPHKMLFLARPYDTWKVECRWLLEAVGFVSEECLYLGVYLCLVVIWNANCLVVPVHFPNVSSLTSCTLVKVKHSFFMFLGSILIFLLAFPFKPSSRTKNMLISILTLPWLVWCCLLASKIKTILLALADSEDSSADEGSIFVLERIPKFRIEEQLASLNMLVVFLSVAWIGALLSGGGFGEFTNIFFMDLCSAADYIGHFGAIIKIIDLTFPDSSFNLHNSHAGK